MQKIPLSTVTDWLVSNRMWAPMSIDIECPHCGRMVNFAFSEWILCTDSFLLAKSRCSGCRQQSTFWVIEARPQSEAVRESQELAVHPSPQMRRQPIASVDTLPPAIAREYISAINVYNLREWTATAASCRRVLEGLVQNQLPRELKRHTLAEQLKALPTHVDHARPITTLTDAIRKGGNMGAHFDEDREADQETVTMMIDLLEYLIEYVYILPAQIDDLHKKVAVGASTSP